MNNFLVNWVEGYGDTEKAVIPFSDLNTDDWGLDEDFLVLLDSSKRGETIRYSDPSGIIDFYKI